MSQTCHQCGERLHESTVDAKRRFCSKGCADAWKKDALDIV